jgi:hypothetical protein
MVTSWIQNIVPKMSTEHFITLHTVRAGRVWAYDPTIRATNSMD